MWLTSLDDLIEYYEHSYEEWLSRAENSEHTEFKNQRLARANAWECAAIQAKQLKDNLARNPPATGPWRTDEPPKDGSEFLGVWRSAGWQRLALARYDGRDYYLNSDCVDLQGFQDDNNPPEIWAEINLRTESAAHIGHEECDEELIKACRDKNQELRNILIRTTIKPRGTPDSSHPLSFDLPNHPDDEEKHPCPWVSTENHQVPTSDAPIWTWKEAFLKAWDHIAIAEDFVRCTGLPEMGSSGSNPVADALKWACDTLENERHEVDE